MSHVLAITFEDETQGPACLRTIKSLRDQGKLKINDAVVVVKDAEGKVKVDNMVESGVKEGALVGRLCGPAACQCFLPSRRHRTRGSRGCAGGKNPQHRSG